MNARDEFRQDWEEPTDREISLERELRELLPWSPSPRLRQRIEAEAARWEPSSDEPELVPCVRRFPPVPWAHVVAAVAAAAALVMLAVAPLWIPGKNKALAAGQSSSDAEQAPGTGEKPQESILWDRDPGTGQPLDWQRDQFLIGSEPVRVVEPAKGPAMLQVRYRLLNRTSWKDGETGAMREQFVPEERVFFVPVRHH